MNRGSRMRGAERARRFALETRQMAAAFARELELNLDHLSFSLMLREHLHV